MWRNFTAKWMFIICSMSAVIITLGLVLDAQLLAGFGVGVLGAGILIALLEEVK